MRVKFIKAYKGHLKGTIFECSPNEAFGLIDAGVAILTKDMQAEDITTKSDEEQADEIEETKDTN
jgi:hypothetical protein